MSGLDTPFANYVQSNMGPPRRLFDLTNEDRAANGVPPVQWSDPLAGFANTRANAQDPNQPLNHYLPDGTLGLQGIFNLAPTPAFGGENLARDANGQDEANMQAINTAWMNSPLHRQNILNPGFSQLGVASNNPGDTYAEIFGGSYAPTN